MDRRSTLRAFTRPKFESGCSREAMLLIEREPLSAAAMRHVLEVVSVKHVRVHDAVLAE